jgi:molybdate transport system regulatory protein
MIELKARVWVDQKGESFLGEGRVRLLESIIKYGSITRASKEVEISYKKAWKLIDSINSVSDVAVVERVVGGKGGGGTVVTKKGENLIKEYRNLQKRLNLFMQLESKSGLFLMNNE